MTLPASPPRSSWTDHHEPDPTEPSSERPFTAADARLFRVMPDVLRALRSAEVQTFAGDADGARDSVSLAALTLLELLGLEERAVDVVRCMVVAAETRGVSDYELATQRREAP